MYSTTENGYKCTELLKMVINVQNYWKCLLMYRITENLYKCTELLKIFISVRYFEKCF